MIIKMDGIQVDGFFSVVYKWRHVECCSVYLDAIYSKFCNILVKYLYYGISAMSCVLAIEPAVMNRE